MTILAFIHQSGVSIVEREDGKKLTSNIKPEFSFEYDELTYTETSKVFIKDGESFELASAQKQEVISFMATIEENKEAGIQLEANNKAEMYLTLTDWKVMRHIREKALNRPTTLSEEEYIVLELERERQADSIIKLNQGN